MMMMTSHFFTGHNSDNKSNDRGILFFDALRKFVGSLLLKEWTKRQRMSLIHQRRSILLY